MSKPGLDGRHRDKSAEISSKHGDTLVRTLRKIYGQGFAAGYPETARLSEILLQLNETSLSQLRRDHETDLQSSFEVSVHPPAFTAGAEGKMNEVDARHEIIRNGVRFRRSSDKRTNKRQRSRCR